MTARRLPTIADLSADEGKGQKAMLCYFSLEEAAAAEAAGIDTHELEKLHKRLEQS